MEKGEALVPAKEPGVLMAIEVREGQKVRILDVTKEEKTP